MHTRATYSWTQPETKPTHILVHWCSAHKWEPLLACLCVYLVASASSCWQVDGAGQLLTRHYLWPVWHWAIWARKMSEYNAKFSYTKLVAPNTSRSFRWPDISIDFNLTTSSIGLEMVVNKHVHWAASLWTSLAHKANPSTNTRHWQGLRWAGCCWFH